MRMSRFDTAPGRPLWLTTLADLSLLLVGFFVLLQAAQSVDRQALAAGIRAGFDADAIPMTVDRGIVDGFAAGSAAMPASYGRTLDFVRGAAADGRIAVTLTGGTAGDVDAATGSAAILASDRARTVAAALVADGAVRPEQIRFAPPAIGTRGVQIDLGFAGDRQAVADRPMPVAAPAEGAEK